MQVLTSLDSYAVRLSNAGKVYLYCESFSSLFGSLPEFVPLLSPDERARADRFHFERDRNRFIVGRAVLRQLLGRLVTRPPGSLSFRYGEQGKPALEDNEGWHFNVSHSNDRLLIGVALGTAVGVDIEWQRSDAEVKKFASRYFSLEEQESLHALSKDELTKAFFRCWTRKEAYIKARGDGLSLPLDHFHVSIDDGPGVELASRYDPEGTAQWTIHCLGEADGYVSALALQRNLSF